MKIHIITEARVLNTLEDLSVKIGLENALKGWEKKAQEFTNLKTARSIDK